jgi:hypothetical protein
VCATRHERAIRCVSAAACRTSTWRPMLRATQGSSCVRPTALRFVMSGRPELSTQTIASRTFGSTPAARAARTTCGRHCATRAAVVKTVPSKKLRLMPTAASRSSATDAALRAASVARARANVRRACAPRRASAAAARPGAGAVRWARACVAGRRLRMPVVTQSPAAKSASAWTRRWGASAFARQTRQVVASWASSAMGRDGRAVSADRLSPVRGIFLLQNQVFTARRRSARAGAGPSSRRRSTSTR